MKKLKPINWAPALCGIAVSLAAITATARPYASGIKNESGVISFTLNESADDVQVIFDGGVSTNNLGALGRGVHTFNLGSNTSFAIHVTKNGGLGYQHADETGTNAVVNLISSAGTNNNLLTFYSPRGVAINQNPASPYFGRIYVGNGVGGTVADTGRFTDIGIFMLNPDETSAQTSPDEALNPNFRMVGSGSSPWELMISQEDDQIYIADWTDGFGNVLTADPEVTVVEPVLKELVSNGAVPVGEDNTHGSINAVHVEGTKGNNLVVYTVDEDLQPDKTTTTATHRQSLWRYDIGSGTFPSEVEGTLVFAPGQIPNTGLGGFAQTYAMDRGANGNFYITNYRAEGTDTSGLIVTDPNGSVLWNSRQASIDLIGGNRDILRQSYKVAVSPDQKYVAVARNINAIWIIPLVNGIPDLTQRLALPAFGVVSTSTSSQMRGIGFDAANNLYAVNTRDEVLRVFAPGGTATTVTTSDGTFQTLTPGSDVSVTAAIPTTTEGSTAGQFTLNRAGETSGSLTVSFTLAGTAANGTDYVTIATNATFASGVTAINIDVTPINDSIAELTETVTLTLGVSDDYAVVSPSSATVSILDNEPTEISITATQPRLLESYAFSEATYQITRLGLISSALTVNLNYTGASNGADFTGPTSVNVPADAATATFDLTPINNSTYHGDRVITAEIVSGTGYSVETPNSADVNLVDDEFPAGTILFADNFNDSGASSTDWVINRSDNGTDTEVTFGFDYSSVGIPAAPNAADTIGAQMRVSFSSGAQSGISISPVGLNLSGDYRLVFDSWVNFNGPLLLGGIGSTQSATAGAGTAATNVNWRLASQPADGVWFSWNGDGGTGLPTIAPHAGYRDYNAYSGPTWFDEASGVYAAGTGTTARNRGDSYYAIWGGLAAPAAQLSSYPDQTQSTSIGALGMAWHRIAVTKKGNDITWTVDGVPFATVDASTNSLGNNVFVGYEDVYAGASDSPEMSFAIVDNLRIETVEDSIEPPTLGLARNGNNITLTWTGSFTLQEASALTGSPSDWADVGGATSGHVVDASSGIKFYRLRQ